MSSLAMRKQYAGTAESTSDYQEAGNVVYQGRFAMPLINNWHYSEHWETIDIIGLGLKIFSWFQHEE